MSLADTLKKIHNSQMEVIDRYSKKYTCVVCGKTDIPYSLVLKFANFIRNEPTVFVDSALKNSMIVCGEKCRESYVQSGLVPYEFLMDGVGVPKRFFGKISDLVSDPKKRLQFCDGWLKDLNKSLYVCGSTGTGKTTFALSLAYELRKLEYRVKFYRSSDLVIRANNTFNNKDLAELLKEITAYDCIIVDDITKHNLTTNGRECIFNLYNYLYEEESLVIFTSNFRIEDVAENIDERLGSRIIEMCSELVLAGKDKRLNVDGDNKNTGK